MASQQSKQGTKPPSVSIREVRLDQFGRLGNTFSGRIAGKALRGNNPAGGVNVYFSVGGIQTPNSPLQTDNSTGEAADDFSVPLDPAITRVLIEARMDWGTTPARRMIDLPTTPGPSASKPKSAVDKLAVNASGKNGNYAVSATTADTDGKPIEGITVMFLYNGDAHAETTNAGGIATHKIAFEQKGCDVTIQVAGVKPEVLRLLGSARIDIPPRPDDLKGFWRSIKAGIKAGLQAKQEANKRR